MLKIGVQDLKSLKAKHLLTRNLIFKKLLNIKVINNHLFLKVVSKSYMKQVHQINPIMFLLTKKTS